MKQIPPLLKTLTAFRCNISLLVAVVFAPVGALQAQAPQQPPAQFKYVPAPLINPRTSRENLQASCAEEQKTDAEEQTTLATYTSTSLRKALRSGPEFWRFLVDPSTSYLDRMAAANQGGPLISAAQLQQLWKAVVELESAPSGVYSPPCVFLFSAMMPPSASEDDKRWSEFLGTNGKTYSAFGLRVNLPEKMRDYPTTIEERGEAPWLWQMQRAMPVLFGKVSAYYGDQNRYPILVQAALQSPPANWREASIRSQVLLGYFAPRNVLFLQMAVKVALEDRYSEVAVSGPDALHPWKGDYHFEELLHAAQIVILQQTRKENVAAETAFSVEQLAHEKYNSYSPQIKPLSTATAILAIGRWATDRSLGPWNRYYSFVIPICNASADAPLHPSRQVRPESPEVDKSLKVFDEWFTRQRSSLEKQAADERLHLQSLASELSLTIQ